MGERQMIPAGNDGGRSTEDRRASRRANRPALARSSSVIRMGALAAALALAWLAFTWFARRSEDEVWARIQASGVMVVATDASYPPFEALDADGNFFGFDIDLAREIGRRLGVRVEFENIGYDGLLGTLVVKRDDVVISAFVPVAERRREVSYTDAYFNAGPVFVVRAEAGAALAGDPAAWASGKRLAAEFGSNADALLRRWARVQAGIEPVAAPSAAEAMVAVEEGRVEAALVDSVSAYDFLLGHPGLKIAGPAVEDELYVMAVNVYSTQLLAALQGALAEMRADGTLEEIRVKWFGEAGREER